MLIRRLTMWSVAWAVTAALYLLLIDITDLPELIVGAVAAALAATGFELARDPRQPTSIRLRWLLRLHRPLIKVPSDVAAVSVMALVQLVRPRSTVGAFRAARFGAPGDAPHEFTRHALAESLGSFAPNTIVVGVDGEREVILVHQLRRAGGTEAVDVLGLR
jgi:multisubunit Na+/H+ antiporter MnhE subunit